MRAGMLTSTITISRCTSAVKGQGGSRKSVYTPFLTTRAQVISSATSAFLAEAGEQAETAIVFRIRHRDGIEAGNRVTLDGREFDLAEVKEIERRLILELRCTGGKQ